MSSNKNLSEAKLKAFNLGLSAVKQLSKKEQAELKKREDEEATAEVFKEFMDSFSSDGKAASNRTWVKGSTFQAGAKTDGGKKKEDDSKLYKPKAYLPVFRKDEESADTKPDLKPEKKPSKPSKKKDDGKKKSNLELFKEELQAMQEERQQRKELKQKLRDNLDDDPYGDEAAPDSGGGGGGPTGSHILPSLSHPNVAASNSNLMLNARGGGGSHDTGDPMTTNLYLGNLNPTMNEEQLCEVFGKFGPLASVKVMWPRTEEERARGRNCGFVAFMNRRDAERALTILEGTDVLGFEMKMGWGKGVPIPPQPVYIPPSMQESMMPPPPTGLPFNAQPPRPRALMDGKAPPMQQSWSKEDLEKLEKYGKLEKFLATCTVKIVIPTDRNLLCLIHRMVEFVVREGPMFEAMIMNRELSNPMFRFLFENFSPAHVYYRWRLFSVLQGDTPTTWRPDEFSMFKGGAKWLPPPKDMFKQGMSDELFEKDHPTAAASSSNGPNRGGGSDRDGGKDASSSSKNASSSAEPKSDKMRTSSKADLEEMIKNLTPEKVKIGEAMVFCLELADHAEEIVGCIVESLSMPSTPIPKKLARLYLVSDLLYNSSARVKRASDYRKFFQPKILGVIKDLKESMDTIESRLKAEQFKSKVMMCFRAWEDWAIYPSDTLIKCQNTFLGLEKLEEEEEEEEGKDLDGVPIDEEVDGKPISALDGKPLVEGYDDDDVDGVPMPGDHDGVPLDLEALDKQKEQEEAERQAKLKFQASKWETVDESTLEAQAVTTSKWDIFESKGDGAKDHQESGDVDGAPMEDDAGSIGGSLGKSAGGAGGLFGGNDSPALVSYGDTPGRDSQDSFSTAAFLKQEMTEEKRKILREVELKVMKFQDEVESGKRSRKSGVSVADQVEEYRAKLLSKADEKSSSGKKGDKSSADSKSSRDRKSDRRGSRSSSRGRDRERSRSRSNSPVKRNHSASTPDRGSTAAAASSSSKRSSRRSPEVKASNPSSTSRDRRSRSPRDRSDRKRSRSRSPRRSSRSPRRRSSRSPPSKIWSSRSPQRAQRSPSPLLSSRRRSSRSPRRSSRSPRRSSRSPRRPSPPTAASSTTRRSSRSPPPSRARSKSPRVRSKSPRASSSSTAAAVGSSSSALAGDTRRIIINRSPSPDSRSRRKSRSKTPDYLSRSKRSPTPDLGSRRDSPSKSRQDSLRGRSRSPLASSSSGRRRSRSRSPAGSSKGRRSSSRSRRSRSRSPAHKKKKETRKSKR